MPQDRSHTRNSSAAAQGHLLARPAQPDIEFAPTGLQPLHLDGSRDGLLYIPASYHASHPAPLVLMLHGAGGNARSGVPLFIPLADATGILLLAPDSREQTWDIILKRYGPDVAFIDRALAQTFSRYAVDA